MIYKFAGFGLIGLGFLSLALLDDATVLTFTLILGGPLLFIKEDKPKK